MIVKSIAVDAIIDGRFLKRPIGDIESLKASMQTHGCLLQPIGVTSDFRLIWGGRRLAAARELGWQRIDCAVYDPNEPIKILCAEYEENECRINFKPSESIALYRHINEEMRRLNPQMPAVERETQAAKQAGFSSRTTARRVNKIIEKADPIVVEAVDAGVISPLAAEAIVNLPVEEQREAVAGGAAATREAAEEWIASRTQAKKQVEEFRPRRLWVLDLHARQLPDSHDQLPDARNIFLDADGVPVPGHLVEVFLGFQTRLALRTIRVGIRSLAAASDRGVIAPSFLQLLLDALKQYSDAYNSTIPYAVCRSCAGHPEGCEECRHTGYLTRAAWDHHEYGESLYDREIEKRLEEARRAQEEFEDGMD